jgi:GntR family transcriptional regulator/MocR family aminotransferase
VNRTFQSNHLLDSTLEIPLYQQLYTHLQTAILSGELKRAMKLPSTRALADELNISRNTVQSAYLQLMSEGYLESLKGSGTYVADVLPEALLTAQPLGVAIDSPLREEETHQPLLAKRARAQIELSQVSVALPPSSNRLPRPFRSELPALDRFPYELWSRLAVQQARRISRNDLAYQDSAGYRPLREAIAAHVTISRRVHCTPEQIIIVSGSQGALDLTARMLINPGDPVWMEDPGYFGSRGAFLGAGARIIPVPIDHQGMVVPAGIERAPRARLVYTTPSHQFPLGFTMSLARRLALLDWAKRSGAYIIEDDYDSEFRFSGHPLAALQGLDDAGRVIYIGTFSKVLFPSLRIGYLIVPPPLVEPFLTVRRLIDMHSALLEQAVLAEFISKGYFTRHLRQMRKLYAERRAALLEATRELPLDIQSPPAGIHCVGWLPDGLDDQTLAREASTYDLELTSISETCIEPLKRKGLLLGYGGFNVQEIKNGVRRLADLMQIH